MSALLLQFLRSVYFNIFYILLLVVQLVNSRDSFDVFGHWEEILEDFLCEWEEWLEVNSVLQHNAPGHPELDDSLRRHHYRRGKSKSLDRRITLSMIGRRLHEALPLDFLCPFNSEL